MLIENGRVGEIVVNPVDHSLIGVRHADGLATLVRIPQPYDTWYAVHTFPYGVVPYDLDISPDGRLLSGSVAEVNGDQFLRVWELQKVLSGDIKAVSEFRFGQSVPESFTFSTDGRYLYGSSYYTGVSNIFRYEVATGAIEAVSNAETGFFRPVPLADGRLVVLNYTGGRLCTGDHRPAPDRGRQRDQVPGRRARGEAPGGQDVAGGVLRARSMTQSWSRPKGPYVPLAQPRARRTPIRWCRATRTPPGSATTSTSMIRFSSPTWASPPPTHRAANCPSDERGHVDITGRYQFWRGELSWNRSDFYDLFGPTKRSRRGYAAKLGLRLGAGQRRAAQADAELDLEYYDKLDTLPNAQNVQTTFSRLAIGKVALHYIDVRRSLGAVDDEKGVLAALELDANGVSGQIIPQLYGNVDLGFPLPDSAFVRLAAHRRGRRQRRSRQPRREFLLRRFRQQLRRRWQREALSRVLFVAGIRHQRGQRAKFRARNGGMESAAGRLRIGGYAGLLSELAAAGGLRRGTMGGPGTLVAAQGLPERSARRPTCASASCTGMT